MRDAGWVGRIERVEGGQPKIGSLGVGWRRVSREDLRSCRRGVGSMMLEGLVQQGHWLDELQCLLKFLRFACWFDTTLNIIQSLSILLNDNHYYSYVQQ